MIRRVQRLALKTVVVALMLLPRGGLEACPVEGEGGDPVLNRLKNRAAVPATFEPFDFYDFATLKIPAGAGRKHRDHWPDVDRALVDAQEKRAVQVVGYLIRVRLEAPESPNCHSDDPAQRDFHLWVTNSPSFDDDDSEGAVVVEVTPRIRSQHPSWSLTNLRRLGMQHSPIRAGGWLMLDAEHPEQVGRTRLTLWEIHPVTKIEVWSDERWREL